jgi:hypothetical protein
MVQGSSGKYLGGAGSCLADHLVFSANPGSRTEKNCGGSSEKVTHRAKEGDESSQGGVTSRSVSQERIGGPPRFKRTSSPLFIGERVLDKGCHLRLIRLFDGNLRFLGPLRHPHRKRRPIMK